MQWTRQLITLWFINNSAKTTINSCQRERTFIITHTICVWFFLYVILWRAYYYLIIFVFKNTNVSSRVLYSFLFLKSAWKNTVFCYVFGKREQKDNNLAHKGLIFPCLKFVQKFMWIWSCYFNLQDILVWECKGGNIFLMKICKILVSTTFWVACINPGSCKIILYFYLEKWRMYNPI